MKEITDTIIGAAIEFHKTIGPGLPESAYEECMAHEMRLRNLNFERQVPPPVAYKGVRLDCGCRLDFLKNGIKRMGLNDQDSSATSASPR